MTIRTLLSLAFMAITLTIAAQVAAPDSAQARRLDPNNVTIYADAHYQGKWMTVGEGSYNIQAISRRVGNDRVSSVTVPRGWKLVLYEHADFRGRSRVLRGNVTFLSDFNDTVSSMRVMRDNPRPRLRLISMDQIRYEIDADRPGGDLGSVPTGSIQACVRACAENSQCRAITWNRGTCYMKRATPARRGKGGHVSAIVRR